MVELCSTCTPNESSLTVLTFLCPVADILRYTSVCKVESDQVIFPAV